jgi:tetratricopeptide (TPR) repeat protein
LTTKAILVWRRPHEAVALVREALAVALENDLARSALRAQFNLSGMLLEHDRPADARRELVEALARARQRGSRDWEWAMLGQLIDVLTLLGEWDEAVRHWTDTEGGAGLGILGLCTFIRLLVDRGELDEAAKVLESHEETLTSSDLQTRASALEARASILRGRGRYAEAIEAAEESVELWRAIGEQHYAIEALAEAAESALQVGDLDLTQRYLDQAGQWPLIERRPLLDAHEARLRGRILAARGEDASAEFVRAAELFRKLELPFWIAVTLLEDGESRTDASEAAALLAEAEATFARLGARPWLERVRVASTSIPAQHVA